MFAASPTSPCWDSHRLLACTWSFRSSFLRLRLRLTLPSLRPGDVVFPSCQTAPRSGGFPSNSETMVDMPQHTAVATLHTNYGDIVVNLFGDHAPVTVENFIGLADGSKKWTDPATG